MVCRGTYGQRHKQDVIIKAVDLLNDGEKVTELNHEIKVYGRLSSLQGNLVPRLIATGTVWDLLKVAIVEPFGTKLEGKTDNKTKDEIRAALSELHQHKVLHGSVARRNYLRGLDGSIKIFDFGRATFDPTDYEKRDELADVDWLIDLKC